MRWIGRRGPRGLAELLDWPRRRSLLLRDLPDHVQACLAKSFAQQKLAVALATDPQLVRRGRRALAP